jgi:hypothetical protein
MVLLVGMPMAHGQAGAPILWSLEEEPVMPTMMPGWAQAVSPLFGDATVTTKTEAVETALPARTFTVNPEWHTNLNTLMEKMYGVIPETPSAPEPIPEKPTPPKPPFSVSFELAVERFQRAHNEMVQQVRQRSEIPRMERTFNDIKEAWHAWEYAAWPEPSEAHLKTAVREANALTLRAYHAWGLFLWSFRMMSSYADPPFHLNDHWKNRALEFHSFAAIWNPTLASRMERPFMKDPAAYMEAAQLLMSEAEKVLNEARARMALESTSEENRENFFAELEETLNSLNVSRNP